MVKIFFIIPVFIFMVFSCQKPSSSAYEDRIVGKWNIESVKQIKPIFKTTDIYEDLGYRSMKFFDNHTVELYIEGNSLPVQGTWNISYDFTSIYTDDDTNVIICQMKLSILWNNSLKYLDENYIDVLTKRKLNFYSNAENQWICFRCEK